MQREGGCGCGSLRYLVRGEPIMVHNCHCRLCQRETGSTSVVNAFWESDRVEWLAGDAVERELPGGSGAMHTIVNCAACGTAVATWYPRLGRLLIALRAGSLDEPGSVTPDVAIFTASKMPWVALPEGVPAFPDYYDAREALAAESVARLAALAARRKAGEG